MIEIIHGWFVYGLEIMVYVLGFGFLCWVTFIVYDHAFSKLMQLIKVKQLLFDFLYDRYKKNNVRKSRK